MNEDELIKLRRILTPLPIIYPAKKLALLFSAKAGCTFAVKWFFFQMGLLPGAEAYDPWVHKYRIEVYYRSPDYRKYCMRLLRNEITVIKIVRDPFARAVSSYIHALKHGYENKAVSLFLGRTHDTDFSFSFSEFLRYLSAVNLMKCNVHHRLQVQGPELAGILKVSEVVKLEEGEARITAIEEKYGLLHSRPSAFSASPHHVSRQDSGGFYGDHRFPGNAKNSTFPQNRNFYNDLLRERVRVLYRNDFETYGYS
jgi:hypothetical protein